MDPEIILDGLLVVSLVFAVLLILVSSATVGRKLADLEYQAEAGIDGVRHIQAWINVRTHLNRVFLGVSFVVITVSLLVDVPMWIRAWTTRVLLMLVLGSYMLSSLKDWLDERKQLRLLQAEDLRHGHARAFAAGIKEAESKTETLAAVAVVPKALDDTLAAAQETVVAAKEAVETITDERSKQREIP